VSYDHGMSMANKIHSSGQAIVWSGAREPAELYWEQLRRFGLTMAPLEPAT
jgi:ATP-dependent Clp protease adaptor protein ClpS